MSDSPHRTLREYRRDLGFYLSRRLNLPLVRPDWVSLMATLRCNLRCPMCRTCYDLDDELDTAAARSLVDQAADWGVEVFNVLGGEPFLRDDLPEILAHAHHRGLIATVTTNGTLLDDAAIAALAPLFRVHLNVSLDGLRATHDAIRGDGVFDRASGAIAALAAADEAERARRSPVGTPWWPREITVNALVHRRNLDELVPLLEHARACGATGVQLLALFDHGDEARSSELWIGPDDVDRLDRAIDQVLAWFDGAADGFRLVNAPADLEGFKRYHRGQLRPIDAPCYNGLRELYVNANGDVLMCDGQLEFLGDAVGNVRDVSLRALWASRRARRLRRRVTACRHACTQDCYRRRESDRLGPIVAGAAGALRRRVRGGGVGDA